MLRASSRDEGRPHAMLYAGLDLSRKRLDFHLLDDEGATVEVGAAPPDTDGLLHLSERVARYGDERVALLADDLGRGVRLIAGVDEAGAGGAWAGPIIAAAVLFDLERLAAGAGRDMLKEVNDSKRVATSKCERLAKAVLANAEAVSIVSNPASRINRIELGPAHRACLKQAPRTAGRRAELRLVDGRLALGADAPAHELIVG